MAVEYVRYQRCNRVEAVYVLGMKSFHPIYYLN